jgi:hypothetical protein
MKSVLASANNEASAINTVQKILLFCGILSSVVFVFTDIFASMQWDSYSYSSQNTGELFATGAPTRKLVISLLSFYNVLVCLFGFGVSTIATQRALRISALCLIGYAIASEARLLFFPMHSHDGERAISNNINILFTGLVVLFTLLAIGYGSTAFGKRFRSYSIGTIIVLILLAIATSINNTRIEEGLSTPGLGILERIYFFGALLWISVFSIRLLQAGTRS